MDTCGYCRRAINGIHIEAEQSVICWLKDYWEAMDTKLFVLLPKCFRSLCLKRPQRRHIPDHETVWTERTFMHKLVVLKWLFSIIAIPARLMNNLGCDWALPDGWNEMPPLAFHQLGELVIPTGWWILCWSTDVHEEPQNILECFIPYVQELDFPLTPQFLFLFPYTGSIKP